MFKEGEKIAKSLGLKEERLKTFIQSGEFLTTALIRCIEGANTRAKRQRTDSLKQYLQDFGVLPMVWHWSEDRTFFPIEYFDDVGTNFYPCLRAFKSLMGFEAYAMAVLEIGHPVMFPLMPLRMQGDNKDKVVSTLDLEAYAAPMFMNYAAPKTSFDSYMSIMSLDGEVCMHRPDALRDPSPKPPPESEESNEGDKDEASIQRLKPDVLDNHLEVLDVARYWMRENRFYPKAKLYSVKELPKEKKIREKDAREMSTLLADRRSGILPKKEDEGKLALAKKVNKWFSQKLKLAKPYEHGYRDII